MSMLLTTLIPGAWARWLIYGAVLVACVVGGKLAWHEHNLTQQGIGYAKRQAEDKAAADAQTQRNLELQRAAEKRYTVVQVKQERFFTKAAQEIHDASKPLAACPVPELVRLRLNAAASCASGDSPAACGDDAEVPGAGPAAGPGHSQ